MMIPKFITFFGIVLCLLFQLVASEEKLQIGLLKKIAEQDCSRKAKNGDSVRVHYTGSLRSDGSVFDSSLSRGDPLEFTLGVGQVIAGWDQGVAGMCIGEKRKLTIPSHLGYGKRGAGNVIPPDADLVFTVELVGIKGHGSDKDEL